LEQPIRLFCPIEEILSVRHPTEERPNQHQFFDELGTGQSKIDRQLSSMGATYQRDPAQMEMVKQSRQVIDLGIPGRGSRRLPKSAPIIANGMEVLTKLRPNIVPDRAIDDSVVNQNQRLTAVIRLLVVELTSIYVDKPG
jgi:hypothetical protein